MQNIVENFIKTYNLQTDATTRYIDLMSELGELGKEIIKATEYGKKNLQLSDPMINEIGDCLFSLLALCCELNVNAEKALLKSLSKYELRLTDKGHIDSGR